jgi:HEPN domain-containing protein
MSLINDVSTLKVNFIFGNIGTFDALDSIIYCINESMHTDKIFLIGTYPAFPSSFGLEYDLLVLIDSNYKKPMHEFESLIANRCHDLAMVTASVHKTDVITRLLQQNNIFFSNLYDPNKLIFNSGSDIVRSVGLDYSAVILEQFENEFNNQYSRARSFLSGAISYWITGDNQLAAFMLHQTVEQGLNALITPLIGYRLQTHNLNKLLLYARRLSQKLYTIFPRNTDLEIQLYQLLHKAYIYGRYKNSFLISKECLQLLIERSTALLEMTQTVFFEKIEELRKIKRLHI